MASNSAWPSQTEVAPWAPARISHLASLSTGGVAVSDSTSAGRGDSRVYDFHGMTATSAGQKLARIFAGKELVESVRPTADSTPAVENSAQSPALSVPFIPPQVIKPVGYQTGLGDKPMTREEQEAANRARREEEAQRPPVTGTNQPVPAPPTQPANNPPPQQQNPQQAVNPGPAASVPPVNGGQTPPNASTPPADNPQLAANAPQQPVAPADEHIFGLPDTTGRKEGDTWEEVLPNGIRRVNTIPYGNGNATVDQVIYNADGTMTWGRVVSNGQGGYQRWNNDSTGQASYYNSGNGESLGGGQSFLPGSSTSGAPDREFVASPDWETTGATAYDAQGNPIGMDIGVRNKEGLYDNTYRDLHGNETFTRTKANPNGGVDSTLVGQVDSTGHGWRLDERNIRWDVFVDDNGNSARKRIDNETGWRSFIYKDGDKTKSETLDSSGRLMEAWTYGPGDILLSSWVREGDTVIRGELGKDGKFGYTFRDLGKRRNGELEYLPDGGYRMTYSNGELFEFDKSGKQTKHRQAPDAMPKDFNQEFAKSLGKGAVNAVVGFGAFTGVNDIFNAVGTLSGLSYNLLPTKKETEEGIAQAADSLTSAVKQFWSKSFTEFGRYGAGSQGFGTTLMNIAPSYLNVLNEESKLLIGTDWKELPKNPGAVLGSATFGIGSFFFPAKVPGIPKRVPLNATDATAVAVRAIERPTNIGRTTDGQLNPGGVADAAGSGLAGFENRSHTSLRTGGSAAASRQLPFEPTKPTRENSLVYSEEAIASEFNRGIFEIEAHLMTTAEQQAARVVSAKTGSVTANSTGRSAAPPSGSTRTGTGTPPARGTTTGSTPATGPTRPGPPAGPPPSKPGPAVLGPDPREPVTIYLWREEGMPKVEFRRKATALVEFGEAGQLIKTKSVRDREVTKKYRKDIIDRIWKQYHEVNPEFTRRLIDRVTRKMQPDHVHELQLGGPDTASNLKFLDAYTNWHIGTQQIRAQIRNLPDGTRIRIEVLNW
ncbi:hypothetical protein ACFYV7_02970 [Nocardia suismassiliense]|uniref:Uncharacterized protein n=1 Tax=Nocardia suismassiliense TaxID=2077092 RepID=A0ABW6QLZ3_9NOCA